MRNYKYGRSVPRLVLFTFLLVSGIWHFGTYGWEAARPEEIGLAIVLLVALLGSTILRLASKRNTKE